MFSYASRVDLTQLLSQPNASWRTLRIPLHEVKIIDFSVFWPVQSVRSQSVSKVLDLYRRPVLKAQVRMGSYSLGTRAPRG